MRTIKTSTTVYQLAELSEEAQQRAIDNIREKLGGDWWDQHDIDHISSVMLLALAQAIETPGQEEYGCGDFPGIDGVEIRGWDLDRGQSISVEGRFTRENAPGLPWVDGIESVDMDAKRDHTYFRLAESEPECTCPPESVYNLTPHEDDCPFTLPNPATEEQRRALDQAARDAVQVAWKAGYDEMEYRTGEEHAKETIEANEYEFTEDGEFYG